MHPLEKNKSDLFPKKKLGGIVKKQVVTGHSGQGLVFLGAPQASRTSGDGKLVLSRREESGQQRLLPHLIGFQVVGFFVVNIPPYKFPFPQNMGNSCYVAAAMQTLLGLPTLLTEAVQILEEIRKKRESVDPITG